MQEVIYQSTILSLLHAEQSPRLHAVLKTRSTPCQRKEMTPMLRGQSRKDYNLVKFVQNIADQKWVSMHKKLGFPVQQREVAHI